MIDFEPKHDKLLSRRLLGLEQADKDYWSFKGNARRELGHGFFQYPAMMVPQVVRAVLDQTCAVHPEIESVGDPFVGSGTIMTESMLKGLSFTGTDINPLAILLCRVKSGPFYVDALNIKVADFKRKVATDHCQSISVDFKGRDKWFSLEAQMELSKLRRAIRAEDSLWARRFFWVVLAETVRMTSNSRTSTFKLHMRSKEELASREVAPIAVFMRVLRRNLKHYEEQAARLKREGHLQNGRYLASVDVKLCDVRRSSAVHDLDLIVTSPPYGDNTTTVPYGQYSYLPLQWIDLSDIDNDLDDSVLRSTHEIDSRSLGGSRRGSLADSNRLEESAESYRHCVAKLKNAPRDRIARVAAFFRDLDASLKPIMQRLKPGGLAVWTLGNRQVGGIRIPLDRILEEMLAAQNGALVCKLARRIPSKRMALKNNVAETMTNEAILVIRKLA